MDAKMSGQSFLVRSGENQPAAEGGRYLALDALRGIAAVGVLVTHCFQIALPEGTLNHTPFRIFANGRSFVIFFFVLSGFVLANSIWSSNLRANDYVAYVKRRIVRLYLPYAIAGIIGAGFLFITHGQNWRALVEYAIAAGTTKGIAINPPSWSMVYELRLSLFMPLIAYFVLRFPAKTITSAIALFFLAEALILVLHIGQFPYGVDGIFAGTVVTLRYTIAFIIGAFVAFDNKHGQHLTRFVNLTPVVSLALALTLLSVLLDQLSLLGAAIILTLALGWEPLRRALTQPIPVWLGRVSFSLYLTHYIILEVLLAVLGQREPGILIAGLTLPLALVAAALFYELVEKPSIQWSRRIRLSSHRVGAHPSTMR